MSVEQCTGWVLTLSEIHKAIQDQSQCIGTQYHALYARVLSTPHCHPRHYIMGLTARLIAAAASSEREYSSLLAYIEEKERRKIKALEGSFSKKPSTKMGPKIKKKKKKRRRKKHTCP